MAVMTPDREAELLAQIETLTDRVIANSEAQADADDLRRENAELRKMLADAPTSEAAVATLREWSASAGPAYEHGPGATHIAMSVAMARKILVEIDGLTRTLGIADDNCSCMAVIAARATVDNERNDSSFKETGPTLNSGAIHSSLLESDADGGES